MYLGARQLVEMIKDQWVDVAQLETYTIVSLQLFKKYGTSLFQSHIFDAVTATDEWFAAFLNLLKKIDKYSLAQLQAILEHVREINPNQNDEYSVVSSHPELVKQSLEKVMSDATINYESSDDVWVRVQAGNTIYVRSLEWDLSNI